MNYIDLYNYIYDLKMSTSVLNLLYERSVVQWLLVSMFITLLLRGKIGLCVTLQNVDPESGSVIRDVEGAQNISLFCEVFNEGSPVQTIWFQQTPDDIEAGRDFSLIPNDDENFIQSGNSTTEMGITVQLNTNLTIVTLTAELDKVIISCATGIDLSSLANFTLRVYQPPRLSDIGEVILRENEELSVDLSEPGSPPAFPFPSDVTWMRGGEQLMNSTDTRLGYPSIFIGSVLPSDAGLYTLTATNHQQDGLTPVGTDTGSFTLNVLFGAGLSGEDGRRVAVVEGDPVTLECGTDLTGNPLPLLVWRDNNAIEVPSGGRFTVSSGRAVVSLLLDSTDREDAGNWTCTAQVYENITTGLPVGAPVERTIQLLVVVAPSAPEDLTLEGVPGPSWISFSWFQTSRGIPPLSRHVVLVVGGGEERNVTAEDSRTTTTVTDLLPGTTYMIRMVAVSEYGDVQAFSSPSTAFTATTAVSVPLPVCSEPPQVVDDRLVVTWTYTHTGGLPISSVDVLFNLDTAPDNRMPFSSVPGAMEGSGSEVTEASILLPEAGLHYQFTVRANNSEGSTEVACPGLRLDTGIPSRPDPPTVTSDKGTVVVMATTAHSGVRNSNVDNFHFILQISNVDDGSKSPIERPQSVACEAGGQQCSASITLSVDGELSEGVKYIVNVRAVNRYGQSEVSMNSQVFSIGEDSGNGGGSSLCMSTGLGLAIGLPVLGVLVLTGCLALAAVVLCKRKQGNSRDESHTPVPVSRNEAYGMVTLEPEYETVSHLQ